MSLVSDTSQSPDTLPMVGYSMDALIRYIYRQLGMPVFDVELTQQHVADCVQDSLAYYGQWRPLVKYGNVQLLAGTYAYLVGVDMGYGIVQVDFVDPVPAPQEIFYGNMISPAPLFRTGLDDYDSFMRWRKTWRRVTSVQPNWLYDEENKQLLVYNPIDRYHAGITAHFPYEKTEKLDRVGAQWVKEYALAKSRYLYGEVMSKFSGAIPGPLKDLQFDQQKRSEAEKAIEKLEQRLQSMQLSSPVSLD